MTKQEQEDYKEFMRIEEVRSKGCNRPNITPCQNKWHSYRLFYHGADKPHYDHKYCLEHKGHLFGWNAGWYKCEVRDMAGNLLAIHDNTKEISKVFFQQ